MKIKLEKPFVLSHIIFIIIALGSYFVAFSLFGGWSKEGERFFTFLVLSSAIALFVSLFAALFIMKVTSIIASALFTIMAIPGIISPDISLGTSILFFIFAGIAFIVAFNKESVEEIIEKKNLSAKFVRTFLIGEFLFILIVILPFFLF